MISGIINVLKPPNMTSHDVVNFLRRQFNIKKIGHTGTLDPYAAGVLPVCVGKATRVAEYFNDEEVTKTYRAELTLGIKTDTKDAYGEILNEVSIDNIKEEEIIDSFSKFTGEIYQKPPMYSAKKIDGKKLYELAREGKSIEREKRKITIYKMDIIEIFNNEKIIFDVECSSGTYVRTLCEDIANDLGNEGYMSFLLRKKVGIYSVEDSYTLEEIARKIENKEMNQIMLPMDSALKHYNKIEVDENLFEKIINGVKVRLENKSIELDTRIRIYCKNNFLGVGYIESKENILKMEKVLFQR